MTYFGDLHKNIHITTHTEPEIYVKLWRFYFQIIPSSAIISYFGDLRKIITFNLISTQKVMSSDGIFN